MSKKTKERLYRVKENGKKDIMWDELITVNKEIKDLVFTVGTELKGFIEKYKDKIDSDPILAKEIIGLSNVLAFISEELKKLEALHKDPKTGEFFKGKVSEDPKEIELYLDVTMGYGGFKVKIDNALQNVKITLGGEVAEKVENSPKE